MASIEEIARRFGITATERNAVRRTLKRRLAKVHPDTTGGGFETDEQRDKYHRISEALAELDATGALVASPRSELVQAVTRQTELLLQSNKLLAEQAAVSNLRVLEAEVERRLDRISGNRSLRPKLTGALIGAVGVFLTASTGSLADIFGSALGPAAAGVAPLLSGIFVVAGAGMALFAFMSEETDKQRLRQLLSEATFGRFLNSPEFGEVLRSSSDDQASVWPSEFSESDVAVAVSRFGGVDAHAAEDIASVMTERMVARNLAERLTGPAVSPALRLNPKIADEIGYEQYKRSNPPQPPPVPED